MRRLRILCGPCAANGATPTVVGAAQHTGGTRLADLTVYQIGRPDQTASPPGRVTVDGLTLIPVREDQRRFPMRCPTCLRMLRPTRTGLIDAFDTGTDNVVVTHTSVTVWVPPAPVDGPDPTDQQWVSRTRREPRQTSDQPTCS